MPRFVSIQVVSGDQCNQTAQVGIYRVNGSAVDMGRLKRAYESNPYEAEQLLKECDIHAVAGILKQYLRLIHIVCTLYTSRIADKTLYSLQGSARVYIHQRSVSEAFRSLRDPRRSPAIANLPPSLLSAASEPEPGLHRLPDRAPGEGGQPGRAEQDVLAQPRHRLRPHHAPRRARPRQPCRVVGQLDQVWI